MLHFNETLPIYKFSVCIYVDIAIYFIIDILSTVTDQIACITKINKSQHIFRVH